MYTVLSTLFCIAGWITALIVNVVWYKHCDKMNNEWYKRCLSINETWADLCMELIGDETDHKTEPTISKMEQVDKDINVRSKDEPQTDIHDLTDCDFCKGKKCEDCEGSKDEPQTDCAWK